MLKSGRGLKLRWGRTTYTAWGNVIGEQMVSASERAIISYSMLITLIIQWTTTVFPHTEAFAWPRLVLFVILHTSISSSWFKLQVLMESNTFFLICEPTFLVASYFFSTFSTHFALKSDGDKTFRKVDETWPQQHLWAPISRFIIRSLWIQSEHHHCCCQRHNTRLKRRWLHENCFLRAFNWSYVQAQLQLRTNTQSKD